MRQGSTSEVEILNLERLPENSWGLLSLGAWDDFFSDIQFKEDGLFMHRSSVLEYYKVGLEAWSEANQGVLLMQEA